MAGKTYDLIVIGGGPGGLEAARYAAERGLATALISNTRLGGRATWSSLLPSKVWLTTAERADAFSLLPQFGLPTDGRPAIDLPALRARMKGQSEAAAARYSRDLDQAGVDVFYGNGKIVGANIVDIHDEEGHERQLAARFVLIASGSGPRFTPEVKPNGDRIIAPKLSPGIVKIPESLIMAGGGVTGSEYAYAFAALGAKVTILHNRAQLVPRVDAEVSAAFEEHLTHHYPIRIVKNDPVQQLYQDGNRAVAITREEQRYEAEYGFIAIGRVPDLAFYDRTQVDLHFDRSGMVAVDTFGRTNLSGIYAVGDVTGTPMVANRATLQARLAVRHMMGDELSPKAVPVFIEAAYTHPSIAQIGDMTPTAGSTFVTRRFAQLLKSHLMEEAEGLLKIHVDTNSGLIRGAAGFGAHVTDILATVQLAINNGITYEQMRAVPFAHPSMSELLSV